MRKGMTMKLELTADQIRIVHDALDIADAWHKHSKRFFPLKIYFHSLLTL